MLRQCALKLPRDPKSRSRTVVVGHLCSPAHCELHPSGSLDRVIKVPRSISYPAHPYRDSYPAFVSDWFLELDACRGDDEVGTESFSYLSELSCKLDTGGLHVLEIRRVVHMTHYVNVPELDWQFHAKLHL